MDSAHEASYACWACGEEIVIPIDPTMGTRQDYVEDCPVCCRPNEIHVELEFDRDADTREGAEEGGLNDEPDAPSHAAHVRVWNDPAE